MKKIICAFSIAVGALLFAQQKVEVKASYGAPSLYGMTESITGSIISAVGSAFSDKDPVIYDSKGVIAVEVMLHSNDSKWKYGVGYNNETVKDSRNNFKGTFNSILAQANYNWNNPDNKFKIYSGAGVGALMASTERNDAKDNKVLLAFNVSPVGIQYGEKLAVFLETNVGIKGLVQGGLSYTF